MATSRKIFIAVFVALVLAGVAVIWRVVGSSGTVRSDVTLIGSLQDELGCPGDWQSECRDTDLAKQPDGTFARDFAVRAGSWDYKVALDHTMDATYSADGSHQGPNSTFALATDATVRFTFDPATKITTLGPAAKAAPAAAGMNSLRASRTDEQFYFVMTDRFANGSTANDQGGLNGDRMTTGFDPIDAGFYHGGDLAGLIDKLDYIQGLGTTAIWLTPSFANRAVQGSGPAASAAYHGYWITDFTTIDPHLGTNQDMQRLIDAVHQRGMRIYFDIITNHTADINAYADGSYRYLYKAEVPYKDASGADFDDSELARSRAAFPAMDPATSFPHAPAWRTPADATARTPSWLNDQTMYHNRGDSTWVGESNFYGDFYGLDDLFTERPEVVRGMIDIYRSWADTGIDGFRIDTVKHVNIEFWQQFIPALLDHAGADFFMFGEVYNADQTILRHYTTTGTLQASLDFAWQSAAIKFVNGEPANNTMGALFGGDDLFTDADSNVYQLPTFLGNHDMGRVAGFVAANTDATEGLRKSAFAHSLMFLTRGQPVVYYGDEQGFIGTGGDKAARQDMFATKVTAFADERVLGGEPGAKDRYDVNHPLYTHIAGLAKLRRDHPTLVNGAQLTRFAAEGSGLLVISRIDADLDVEYVVVANNSSTATSGQVVLDSRNTTLTPIFGGGTPVSVDGDGRASVEADGQSVRVYRAEAKLPARTTAPKASTLTVNVPDRSQVEFTTALSEPAFSEVAFLVRPLGTTPWQPLGVDDTATYRVRADLSEYPPATLLETRAVVTDASGNVSTTDGTLILPPM